MLARENHPPDLAENFLLLQQLLYTEKAPALVGCRVPGLLVAQAPALACEKKLTATSLRFPKGNSQY